MFEVDQAAGLRSLFAREPLDVIVLAGECNEKSSVAASMAMTLATQGRRVMIVDGSVAEVPMMFGLSSRFELAHIITGDKALRDVLLEGPHGIYVLPSARGIKRLDALSHDEAFHLRHEFSQIERPIDTLIVNARPGCASQAVRVFQGRPVVVTVVSEIATSIKTAYAEMKTILHEHGINKFDLLVGSSRSAERAGAVYENLAEAVNLFLNAELNFCGLVSNDGAPLVASVKRMSERKAIDLDHMLMPKGKVAPRKELRCASIG